MTARLGETRPHRLINPEEVRGTVDNNAKSPFSAIKVVECGEGIAAAYGAKMLADVGAEVIKVEPPEGDLARRRGPFPGDQADPEKSGIFIYLNTNKRGVVADLTRPEGRELLAKLLADADESGR